MFRTILIIIAMTCTSLPQSQASAADRALKTRAGKAVGVISYGNYSSVTCLASALPRFRIFRKPKNGTLRTEVRSVKIKKKGYCHGKPIKALFVYYVPNRGFRGMDSGQIGFTQYRYTEGAATKHIGTSFEVKVE